MYDIRFMAILYSHCSTVTLLKNIKLREHAEAMNEICLLMLKDIFDSHKWMFCSQNFIGWS